MLNRFKSYFGGKEEVSQKEEISQLRDKKNSEKKTHVRILRRTEHQQKYRKQLYKDLMKYRSKGSLGKELAKDLLENSKGDPQYESAEKGITKSQVLAMFYNNDSDAVEYLYRLDKKEIEKIEGQIINSFINTILGNGGWDGITVTKMSGIMKATTNGLTLVEKLMEPLLLNGGGITFGKPSSTFLVSQGKNYYKELLEEIFLSIQPKDIKNIIFMCISSDKYKNERNKIGFRDWLLSHFMDKVSIEDQKKIVDILHKNNSSISNYQDQIYPTNQKEIFKKSIFLNGFSSISQKNWNIFSLKEKGEIYDEHIESGRENRLLDNFEYVDKTIHPKIFKVLLKKEDYKNIANNLCRLQGIIIDKELGLKLLNLGYGDILRKAMDTTPKIFSDKQ